jgi:hypothetical protein
MVSCPYLLQLMLVNLACAAQALHDAVGGRCLIEVPLPLGPEGQRIKSSSIQQQQQQQALIVAPYHKDLLAALGVADVKELTQTVNGQKLAEALAAHFAADDSSTAGAAAGAAAGSDGGAAAGSGGASVSYGGGAASSGAGGVQGRSLKQSAVGGSGSTAVSAAADVGKGSSIKGLLLQLLLVGLL